MTGRPIKMFLLQANEKVYLYTFDLQEKPLKGLLQNTYLMLDLVYHKRNLLFTTVVDGSTY